MNKHDLLVLANECCAAAPAENGLALMMDGGDLERFAAKIAQAEREACAITAAIHSQYPITTDYDRGYAKARKDCAADIRARSTP